mmetsp:Transcript_28710/g.66215  ORF Transcript_28710/g.66215 Transcript_28710/m.66215 type:complete len:1021 (+) Transcript_28710:62-3124(+)
MEQEAAGAKTEAWQRFQEQVFPAIVALKVTAVRSFQDGPASSHGGTGFVVDAKAGLILTNRHVCTVGPQRCFATFVGSPASEEVRAEPAYIDPTHDFALLRFDPNLLEQTPKMQIELNPAGCRVGEEVRVIGNDSLEKLQILSGTIARIDRNAPEMAGDYVDENTFYVIAGSGTRGGSSGSPVLNQQGQAVALNAAALPGTMHGLFLPLHRIVRVLELVRQGLPVSRGTLCAAFAYTPFPECERLGVSKDFKQQHVLGHEPPQGTTFTGGSQVGGMLKVLRCIPGTPAASQLQPGDMVLKMNGQSCFDFVVLDTILDSNVGKCVELLLCRGDQTVEVSMAVQDLHSIIPHGFIELALGVFHNVPYQTAMKHFIPVQGVYVAQAGFVFGESVKSDAVILEINGTPCSDMTAFENAMARIADKEYFTVVWMVPKDAKGRHRHESMVKMQRQFFTTTVWTLDRPSRRWSSRQMVADLDNIPAAMEIQCPTAKLDSCNSTSDEEMERGLSTASTTLPPPSPPATRASPEDVATPTMPPLKRRRSSMHRSAMCALDKTICSVLFRTVQHLDMDLLIDGSMIDADVLSYRGAGVVLDAELGLVLTDRTTIPQSLGDIEVTLGDDSRSATVWFTHPTHSLVVLKLSPPTDDDLPATFGKNAAFDDHGFAAGEESDFVGVDDNGQRFAAQVEVQQVKLTSFPQTVPPRWRQRNLEAALLKEDPPNARGGVLCDADGVVHGMYVMASWVEESELRQLGYCMPCAAFMPLLEHLKRNGISSTPLCPSLEVELKTVEVSKLRRLPLKVRPPTEWLKRLGKSALQITGITSTGPLAGMVAEGDFLVAIEGVVPTTAQEVDAQLHHVAARASEEKKERTSPVKVELSIMTRGKVREVQANVALLGHDATNRLIGWHGMVLREIPRSVHEVGDVPAGLHIAQMLLGSPAEADGVDGDVLIAVNGTPVPSLDALLALKVVDGLASTTGHRCHLRIETTHVGGQRQMITLEPDPTFWPTLEMIQDSSGSWSCTEVA